MPTFLQEQVIISYEEHRKTLKMILAPSKSFCGPNRHIGEPGVSFQETYMHNIRIDNARMNFLVTFRECFL
jgi:hypothetical protein